MFPCAAHNRILIRSQTDKTSSFWIIAEAIKRFYDKHQELPLPGNVPDMKAESQVYIALQNIYKAKARQDALEVLETAKAIAPGHEIDPTEVDLFCKNAAFVKLVNARTGGSQGADRLAEVAGMYSLVRPSRRPLVPLSRRY